MITQQLDWFNSLPVDRAEKLKIEFAAAIDRAIIEQALSRKEIAKRIDVSSAWISKVLRGDANLTIESMSKLADAAGYVLHIDVSKKAKVSVSEAEVFNISSYRKPMYKGAKEAIFEKCTAINDFGPTSEFQNAA